MARPRRLSTKPIAQAIRRWPSARAREWTKSFIDAAQADPNVLAVVAVGSAVRPGVASTDLDIVVVCVDRARLTVRPPIEVDLRPYAAADVDRLLEHGHDLLAWSLKFGQLLLERDSYWSSLLRRWRGRIPLPLPDVAKRRARACLRRLREVVALGDENAATEQALSYLTHLARAELSSRGVFPASRPELPKQLRGIGSRKLAALLEDAVAGRSSTMDPAELADAATL